MEDNHIYKELTELFQDIFRRGDLTLTPNTTASDVFGWDSFKQIDIMIAIEQKYGIKFRTRELENLNNVGDLVCAILAKSAAK